MAAYYILMASAYNQFVKKHEVRGEEKWREKGKHLVRTNLRGRQSFLQIKTHDKAHHTEEFMARHNYHLYIQQPAGSYGKLIYHRGRLPEALQRSEAKSWRVDVILD